MSGTLQPIPRIIKGDARGTFDRFCFAFVMVKGNDDLCNQVIKKVAQVQPDWKINIKVDNDRFKYMQQAQQQTRHNPQMNLYQQPSQHPQHQRMNFDQKQHQQSFYPQQNFGQNQPHQQQQYQATGQQMVPPLNQPFYASNTQQNQYQQNVIEPEKIVGEKQNRILVRQIWLGGIPQLCDKHYMHQLMSEFGMVENLEIFPKFAFIKFRMVQQATLAYERAQRIFTMFGNPPGFRILFSDPARRANIVGNHYEYDRQILFTPVLFLGFPPVTSATIDIDLMKSICEKFGPIVNSYMRKNTNNQTRSYFLFTYDNIKNAIRAKIELNKRRDLLGDKRVQVTLLLDEEIVLKNRDLSHTEKMFSSDGNASDRKRNFNSSDKPQYEKTFQPRTYQNYLLNKQVQPMTSLGTVTPYPGMYQQPPLSIPYPGYGVPPTVPVGQPYHPQGIYYMQNVYPPFSNGKQAEKATSTNVHELLQSVFQKSQKQVQNPNIEKKPIKTASYNDQNTSDIVSKMLGNEKEPEDHSYFKERQVTWSGFLTWKGLHRVQVDGYAESKELEDYVISITHIMDLKDLILKEKTAMILACGSPIHEAMFKEYLRALRGKAGVSSTPHSLMYILTKSKETDQIQEIRDNELLVVMQRPSLFSLIKDKLQKCQQLK